MSIYGKDIADTSRTIRAGQRSAVDTGALVGAQYLGFVYGAGVFANGIPLVRLVGYSYKWTVCSTHEVLAYEVFDVWCSDP